MGVRVGLWRRLSTEELMLLNFHVGEDSCESIGLQGVPTSPFWRRSALGFLCREWCWSWNSSTLATSCKELTHWKRLWCWEGLGAGEGDDRGWDGWMASLTRWTWVWVNSGSWGWTGRPGVLQFMGLQRVGHYSVTEMNWTEPNWILSDLKFIIGNILSYYSLSFKFNNKPSLFPVTRNPGIIIYKTCLCVIKGVRNKYHRFLWTFSIPFMDVIELQNAAWSLTIISTIQVEDLQGQRACPLSLKRIYTHFCIQHIG